MDLATCTIDGHNINDTTNYVTTLPDGWDSSPRAQLDSQATAFGPDLATRRRQGKRVLRLCVKVMSSLEGNRRQLLKWFKVGEPATSTQALILDASGFAEAMTIYGWEGRTDAQQGALVYIDFVCDDPIKYGAYALRASDASATASPMTKAVANTGDTPMPIVLRMSPSTTPTNRYRIYLRAYNNHTVPLTDYWFLVTWDHATNVGAGRSLANGDDVRVFVDGKEAPRYCPNWNNAASRIWWRMDMPAKDLQWLNGGPNGSGSGSTPILSTDTPPFNIRCSRSLKADNGYLLIDAEAFAYRRLDSYRLQITKRALMQTSAANHGYSAGILHLPHEVVLEFGDAGNFTDIMTNGGFETAGGGGADVFGTWSESASDGAIARDTGIKYAGAASAKLTAGASINTYVYESRPVTPGKTYQLDFWTRGDGTYGGRYYVYDSTNAAYLITTTATGITGTSFSQVTATFTCPANCNQVLIGIMCPSTNTGIAYFDNVTIRSSPAYDAPRPSFNLTNSNNAARSWDITTDDFGPGAVERDDAWKYSNQKGHRGAIFRSTVPSGSWESRAQKMYAGVALSRGYYAGYPDIGLPYNTWYWQSPIPIDRVRSVVIQTSANPTYAVCKLMYRAGPLNQAGARYVNVAYGPAASTYSGTEATYTALTVSDTSTGLNSPELAFVVHQVQFRDVWPRDRFRLHSLIVDLDSTKMPVITPASPISGTAHVTECDWSFGIETSTGGQRMEIGVKNTPTDRYLEVNCLTGEIYWYEKATASAVTNAATPENEKTPAAVTYNVLHQGGKWLEIVKGGENVVIDFTGSARVKMQIIAPMRYA